MKGKIEEDLKAKIEDLFESFQEEAIAAASIGQVYKARLKSGPVPLHLYPSSNSSSDQRCCSKDCLSKHRIHH